MDLNKVIIADIEADALYEEVTKIHVLSYATFTQEGWSIKSTKDPDEIRGLFSDKSLTFAGHNFLRYDKPTLEKILGFKVEANIIDSLSLSWWLMPTRTKRFGLEEFGVDYGVNKIEVNDWKNLSYEDYKLRCETDVKINVKLWVDLIKKARLLYSTDEEIVRLINLLNFIMTCSFNQEIQKVKVDVKKTEENLKYFESLKEEKVEILRRAMPKDIKYGMRTAPAVMYKKDGGMSVAGTKWVERLKELKLPLDTNTFEDIISVKDPNPNSVSQKKAWLFSLGWVPETFKFDRDKKTGKVTQIEQIVNAETKELCPSVAKLIEKEPAIEALGGLSVLTHRIGILKAFLEKRDEKDMISQGLIRLAVTMRWQHAVIVNIPKVTGRNDIRDGKWLRECLIAGEGYRLVQSDLSGIESRTSDHYTFKLNPERIKKTQQPYFDPHTELSVVAGLMTPEEEAFYVFKSAKKDIEDSGGDSSQLDYKNFSIYPYNEKVQELHDLSPDDQKKKMQELKNKRSKGKTTNYASLYLVGSKTLSRNLGVSVPEAQKLIDSYWEVHWAVKAATDKFKTKTIGDETWIFNPVSRFWYYLRNDKDKFSVVNQSSAVFLFNLFCLFVTKRVGFPIVQTHDDLMLRVKDDDKVVEETMAQVKLAIEDVNKYITLNVRVDCEVQNGYNFSQTH